VYITWQGIGLNKDKLNWLCVNVYGFVDETGQFHLLVFQREFEHGNKRIWTRSLHGNYSLGCYLSKGVDLA
jgi:hypothetical protein